MILSRVYSIELDGDIGFDDNNASENDNDDDEDEDEDGGGEMMGIR